MMKVRRLSLTILRPGITTTCMHGFRTHSGVRGSGSQGSSFSEISTGVSMGMATREQFQITSGIQEREESVELIQRQGRWEMPWRIYPVPGGSLPPVKPAMAHHRF